MKKFTEGLLEKHVEANAGVFERMKGYLVKRWDYYKKKTGK